MYTYTWSARGQLLVESIQGYLVRTFTYDTAGRLTQATLFTLTTRFTYHGEPSAARRSRQVGLPLAGTASLPIG